MDLSQLSQIKENDKAKALINEATQANAQVVKNSVNQTSINVSATYSFLSVLTGEGGKITNDELALSQVKLQRQLASLAQDPQKAENANGAPKQKPLMELVSKLISRDLDLQEEVAFNLTTRLEIVKTSDAVDTLKSYCDTLPKVFQESNDAGKALMKYLCEVIVNKTTSDNISPAMTRQLAMEQIFAPDGELTPKTSMILDKLLGATIEFIRANQPDVLASFGRESSQVLSPNSTRAQMASFIMESLGDEVDDATYLDIFTSKSKDFTDEQSEVIAKRVEEIITKAADTARSANLLDDEPKAQSENQDNNLKENKPLDITVRELNRRSGEIQKSIDDDALENIQKDTIKRESIEELAEKIKKEFSAQNSNVDKNIASKTIEEKPQQIDKELDKLEKNNNQEANLEKENNVSKEKQVLTKEVSPNQDLDKKSMVNQSQTNEVSKNNETIKGNETTNERDAGILREAIVKNLADSIKNNTQENQESFIKNIDLENEFENFELPKSNVQGEPLTQGDEERIKYILSNAASAARNSNLLDSNDELPQNKTSILVDESLVKKQVYDELKRSLDDDNNAKNLSNQTSKTLEVKANIHNQEVVNQEVKASTNPQITDNDNETTTLNKVDSKNDALNKVLDSEEKFTSEIKDILQKADDIRNYVGSKALDVDNDNINNTNNKENLLNNNKPLENKALNPNEAQILAKAQDALKPNSSNDSVVNNTTQNNSQFENESKNTQEVNQKVQNNNELFTKTKISNEPNSLLNDKDLEEGISQGIKLSDLENALNKTQENKEVKPNLDEKIKDNSKINANSLEENDLEDKTLEINNKENSNQALKPNVNEEILINNLPNDEDNQIQKIGDNLALKDNKSSNVNLNTLVNVDENLINDDNKSNISSKLPNEKLIIEKAFEGIKNSQENDPLTQKENNLTQKSSLNPLNKEGVKTSLDGLKEPQESVVLTKNNEETNQVNKELSNEKTGLENKSNDVLSQNKPLETSSKNPNISDLLNDSKDNSQNNDGKNSLPTDKSSTNEGLKNTLDLIAKKLADNNGSRTNPYINQDSSKASESLKENNLPNNPKNELGDGKTLENSNKNPSANEEVKDVSRTIKENSSTPKNNVEAQNLPHKDNSLENSSNVNNQNEPLPKVNETSRVLENVYNKYSVGKPSYENTPNDNLAVNNSTTTESTIKFDNKLDDDALLPKDVNDGALEAKQVEEHHVESKPTLFKRFFGMFKKEAPSNIEINNTQEQEPIKENIASNEVKGDIKNVNLNDSSMGSMVNNLGRIINDGKITPEIRDMAKHIQEAMTNPLGDLQAVSEWLGLVSAPMSASGPRAQAMQQWALLLLTIRFKQLGKKIDKFKNTDEFKKLLENVKLGNDKNWPQNSLNQTLSHIEKLQNNNQDSAYPIPSYIPLPPTYEKGHEGALMIEHQKDEDNEIEWKLNFFFDLDKIGAMQVKTSLKVPNLKIQVVTESLVGLQKVKETIDTLTKRFGEYGLNVSNVSARLGTVYPPKKLESSSQTNVSNNDGLSFRI